MVLQGNSAPAGVASAAAVTLAATHSRAACLAARAILAAMYPGKAVSDVILQTE